MATRLQASSCLATQEHCAATNHFASKPKIEYAVCAFNEEKQHNLIATNSSLGLTYMAFNDLSLRLRTFTIKSSVS